MGREDGRNNFICGLFKLISKILMQKRHVQGRGELNVKVGLTKEAPRLAIGRKQVGYNMGSGLSLSSPS